MLVVVISQLFPAAVVLATLLFAAVVNNAFVDHVGGAEDDGGHCSRQWKGSGEVSKTVEQEERLARLEEFREDDCFAVKSQVSRALPRTEELVASQLVRVAIFFEDVCSCGLLDVVCGRKTEAENMYRTGAWRVRYLLIGHHSRYVGRANLPQYERDPRSPGDIIVPSSPLRQRT